MCEKIPIEIVCFVEPRKCVYGFFLLYAVFLLKKQHNYKQLVNAYVSPLNDNQCFALVSIVKNITLY